jgi:GAF domain-containing protein
MKNIFSKINSLKLKFLLQYGIIIILSVFLMIIMMFSLKEISSFADTRTQTQELAMNLFQMRKAEKEFIINDVSNEDFFKEKKSDNINTFNFYYSQANSNIANLKESFVVQSEVVYDSLSDVSVLTSKYNILFSKLVDKIFEKGFKNWGVEGKLRDAIHAIEKGGVPYDKTQMLTLRRCEKDFLLRKDVEYVDKFQKEFKVFLSTINKSATPELYRNANEYHNRFLELVSEEKEIGLTSSLGIKHDLNQMFETSELKVLNINSVIKEKVESSLFNSYLKLIVLFVIQLVLAVYLAFSFAKSTSSPIRLIDERITDLSEGVFPEPLLVHGRDEIAHTSLSFNNLLHRINVASDFAKKIGQGELDIEYDQNYANDVLGSSLQSMHVQLKAVAQENERRNWINEGLAKFVDLLRKTDDIEVFYNLILSNLIKYTGANQGYFYVVNDQNKEDVYMEIAAVYAYGKQRYLEEKNQIRFKQGLVGQAWFDMDTLFFTEIPAEYVKITSGVGEATPRCIAIIPLISNDEVVGAIEIASFSILDNYKVEFVNKLSETLANAISSLRTSANTLKLLEQSQMLTADLREQEEEIRQNMEEMNATQEEMERKEREMNRRMKSLESELEELRSQNESMSIN